MLRFSRALSECFNISPKLKSMILSEHLGKEINNGPECQCHYCTGTDKAAIIDGKSSAHPAHPSTIPNPILKCAKSISFAHFPATNNKWVSRITLLFLLLKFFK